MSFDTSDMATFFSDFAVTANAKTWGNNCLSGIFDIEYVEFDDISRESPTFLIRTSDVFTNKATGDLFVIDGKTYKLVNVQYAEPGITRLILANR